MRIKNKTNIDYLDLISSIKAPRVLLQDIARGDTTDTYCYAIRHDVDYDLDKAVEMAKFEESIGIHSTYFFLHTADYFDYSADLQLAIRYIYDGLGHDIGFHNDIITVWRETGKDLREIVEKPLEFFRTCSVSSVGVELGTSCHGHEDHYNNKYLNYEVWKEFDPTKNEGLIEGVPKDRLSLAEFGLEYEAYFLDYDFYLSDSGGNWIGLEVEEPKLFERNALYSSRNIGLKIIDKFNKVEEGILQVLIHPNWWEFV